MSVQEILPASDEEINVLTAAAARYRGRAVVSVPSSKGSLYLLGIIFLGGKREASNGRLLTLRHEYGHHLQKVSYGWLKSLFGVYIPSAINHHKKRYKDVEIYKGNYYHQPWELDADYLGGSVRGNPGKQAQALCARYRDYLCAASGFRGLWKLITRDCWRFAKHDFTDLGIA